MHDTGAEPAPGHEVSHDDAPGGFYVGLVCDDMMKPRPQLFPCWKLEIKS